MRSSLFTVAAIVASNTASAYDVIDVTSGNGTCNTCQAAMTVVNPALSTDLMTQVATLFFKLENINRPDLEAATFI